MNKEDKRGVDDIAEYLELRQVVNLVLDAKPLPYYGAYPQERENLRRRDSALLAALALTGLRISELLSVKKEQVVEDEQFLAFKNVAIKKRRKEHILRDFYMPKEGATQPLTLLVNNHTQTVKKGKVFTISRSQAYRIINGMTGLWCHFFRSQRLSYLVNKFDGTKAAAFQGVKSPATIAHYYKGGIEQHKEQLIE